MSLPKKPFWLNLLVVLFSLSLTASAQNSDTAKPKDAQSALVSIRLKKLTKDLDLTEEQQKKVFELLQAESKGLEKVRTDDRISFTERSAKIKEAQLATYAKMKPLLTEAQLQKFEKMLTSSTKPKKK